MKTTNVLIAGAGVGGCACALAACREGLQVIMTEETDWIGGQWTSQATPPDEHGWIETLGCTALYREVRNRVRNVYRTQRKLTQDALKRSDLNPGDGWVSPLCAEPKVFLEVLLDMLAPYLQSGQLEIWYQHRVIRATQNVQQIEHVVCWSEKDSFEKDVKAQFFVDATELGDLLPLTGTDFVTGAESQMETGEPSAKKQAEPSNVQAFSVCFAMGYDEQGDHTIPEPPNYGFWRSFIPNLSPAWPGPLLELTGLSPRTLEPVHYRLAPHQEPNQAFSGLWTYRRILHRDNFEPGVYPSDITLVNYPQIDYLLHDLTSKTYQERQKIIEDAKNQSLSFLYYLQTEKGLKGLYLCPEVMGTSDGLAKSPYIRESRRIKAMLTITEQDLSAQHRPTQKAREFSDSVGIGYYRIDLHPSTGGDNYLDVESLPFQIPLGALIPQKTENLLPACKNIGTTHITNGCYRLHPIEWNIGEVVGYLIRFCLDHQSTPQEIYQESKHIRAFQDRLVARGIELAWPNDLNLADGDPHRHAQ